MIKGILIDVDGTLILSNDAHAHSWIKVLSDYKYKVSLDLVRSYMGMGGDQMLPKIIPELKNNPEKIDEISKKRKKLFLKDFAPKLSPAPGARKLLKKIRDKKIQYAIASSSSDKELEILLKIANIDDMIEKSTSGSDVKDSKPEPDIIKAALKEIKLDAKEVLMLGDTPYDIQAASKCNVKVIAFRCGGFSDKALKGAISIYDDPSDLLSKIENSPICK